jgi:Cu(I)/Ag(I) efflux system protein CusF
MKTAIAVLAMALAANAWAQVNAEGEVRKVDKETQRMTIRHGPIPELDMQHAMTMVFRVKDQALLDKAAAGDKVRFRAEKSGGAYFVTEIERAK